MFKVFCAEIVRKMVNFELGCPRKKERFKIHFSRARDKEKSYSSVKFLTDCRLTILRVALHTLSKSAISWSRFFFLYVPFPSCFTNSKKPLSSNKREY